MSNTLITEPIQTFNFLLKTFCAEHADKNQIIKTIHGLVPFGLKIGPVCTLFSLSLTKGSGKKKYCDEILLPPC